MFELFKSAFSLFKIAYSLSEEMNWAGTPAGRKRLGGLLWEVNKSPASESSIDKAVDELREFTKSGVPGGLSDSAAGESAWWLRNIALSTPYANWGSLKDIAIQANKDLSFYWDHRPNIIAALGPQVSQLSGIASLSELDQIVTKFGSIRIENLNKSREKEVGLIWNLGTSGDWRVDVPYNREGAAVLGHKTSWCTTRQDAEGDYHFDKYHQPSDGMYLYVFTNNRTGDRYQAFFNYNSLEVRDEQNQMVSSDLAIQLWNVLKSLKDLPEGSPVEKGSLERSEFADNWDDGSADALRLKRTVKYLNNQDQLHREDGPAIIYPDGTQEWYRNGVLHRGDGPAVVHPDGKEEWYRNGKAIPAPVIFDN